MCIGIVDTSYREERMIDVSFWLLDTRVCVFVWVRCRTSDGYTIAMVVVQGRPLPASIIAARMYVDQPPIPEVGYGFRACG